MSEQNSAATARIADAGGVRGGRGAALTYSRELVAELVEREWSGTEKWLVESELDDLDVGYTGAELVLELIDDLGGFDGAWHLTGRPAMPVKVSAHTDPAHCVVILSVHLGGGAVVGHCGIESLRALPHTSMKSVSDVLDGV